MGMTLVSFYADPPGTRYYTSAARRLAERCRRYGVPHVIRRIPDAGNWLSNTNQKPAFIRAMLDELGSVLWLDVDCTLNSNPLPIAHDALMDHDAAFTPFKNHASRQLRAAAPLPDDPRQTPLRVMGIAQAWRQTDETVAMLTRWDELCRGPWSDRHGDHRLMQHALDEMTVAGELRWTCLPVEIRDIVKIGLAVGVPGRSWAMGIASQ